MEDEELKNFRHQWRKADKDGSGTLDKKEIISLVQKVQSDEQEYFCELDKTEYTNRVHVVEAINLTCAQDAVGPTRPLFQVGRNMLHE